MLNKKTIHLQSYPPEGWTPAQWQSAERVTERFDKLPVNPDHWQTFNEFIGRKFGSMFIGIEKDGYAHT